MVTLADRLAVDLVKNQVDMTRYAESVRLQVSKILSDLQTSVQAQLSGKDPTRPIRTVYQKQRLEQVLAEVDALIGGSYDKIEREVTNALTNMAVVQQASVLGIVNGQLGTNLLTHALTKEQLKNIASDVLIKGAPSSAWWAKQAEDLRFAFEREMREGMLKGETLGELVQRIRGKRGWKGTPGREALPGFFDTTHNQAEALVRTSVLTVANQTHLDVYRANSDVIDKLQWISTLDSRTTPTCRGLDGLQWDLETLEPIGHDISFPGPIAHWGCRSTQIPITKSWEDLASTNKNLARKLDEMPASTRASINGPVSSKMNYEQFLEKLREDQQIEILGKGRWEIWQKTKGLEIGDPARITLSDMLDQRGNPLSLSAFAEKVKTRLTDKKLIDIITEVIEPPIHRSPS